MFPPRIFSKNLMAKDGFFNPNLSDQMYFPLAKENLYDRFISSFVLFMFVWDSTSARISMWKQQFLAPSSANNIFLIFDFYTVRYLNEKSTFNDVSILKTSSLI